MVEVDCDTDEIANVVTLPSEIRLDRDDAMRLCIYDEAFRRQPADEQPQMHALYIAGPEWPHPAIRGGSPVNWARHHRLARGLLPARADDDAYGEVHPCGDDDQEY